MNRIFYNILGMFLLFLLTACVTEEFVRPTIELELSANVIDLNLNMEIPSAKVNVMQGNKEDVGYTVESSNESIATASIEGVEIIIRAVSEGSAIITVMDSHGMFDTIEVNVSVDLPNTPTFNWNGEKIVFDRVGGFGITILTNKIALTDILDKNVQYILTWTGELTEGKKADGSLKKIGRNIETEVIDLPSFTVLRADETNNYITFSDGVSSGELFFSR